MASKNTPFQVTLSLTAIVLTFFLSQSEATTEKSVQTIKGNLSVTDLCVNNNVKSCTGLTLNQANGICNNFSLKPDFAKIEEAKCNGATCHLGMATNNPNLYTVGIDCHQDGPIASCTCYFYLK
uniref:Uncharacterized protein n=1 Tax=Cacopsylla melanoneura TaxID=428564 RepID=A0A8D8LI71_9HEMI